jgi:hypothetical protein
VPTDETAVPLVTDPPGWARGSASLEDDHVVLDMDTAERYFSQDLTGLMLELARIQEPDHILGFVSRYGMLQHGPDETGVCREPVREWMSQASMLWYTLDLAVTVAEAVDGDLEAIARLHDHDVMATFGDDDFPKGYFPEENEILHRASAIVARLVDYELGETRERLIAESETANGKPGTYLLLPQPRTLLGYAYHELALAIVDREPFDTCPACGGYFIVEHGRQQYCSPRCANRSRYRRFADERRRQKGDQSPPPRQSAGQGEGSGRLQAIPRSDRAASATPRDPRAGLPRAPRRRPR